MRTPMDRIQRALDLTKVAVPRAEVPPAVEDTRAERVALSREFSLGSVESVARLAVDWQALKEQRVISTGDLQPAGQAYRMLRTQVLHRCRSNGMGTIGVV